MGSVNTGTQAPVPTPNLFVPHPGLSDELNRAIVKSEIEGGVHLDDLAAGTVLRVETQNHEYTIIHDGPDRAWISGHPQYCPDPVPVSIAGSTFGGTALRMRYIGRGMHLEFWHPVHHTIITSCIVDIRTTGHVASLTPV